MQTPTETRLGIALYLVLTFAFSSVFYFLIITAGTLRAQGGLYVYGLMWSPGVAALLTRWLRQRNLKGMGWGWGATRYQVLSYLIPLAYAAAAYLPVWLLGLGDFNADFLRQVAARFGWEGQSPAATLAFFLLLAGTVGIVGSCLSALGEEIGWRGFLVPELAKVTSFTRTALLSGIVWSVWHYPVILFADYRSSTPLWYALLCFTAMVLGISFLFAWMRLKSGSLWTGMFLHASHNLFIQGVFDPLTKETGITSYLLGEFGAALAFVGLLVGFLCWRKRTLLSEHRRLGS